MKKIGAFIVARLGSSRLKEKNLLPILGKPMIQHLVERVKRAKSLSFVAVATSTDSTDDALEAFAKKIGVACYRGALDPVMARMAGAVENFGCDYAVEILGDNPLVHAGLIDDVVNLCLSKNLDYASNITNEYKTIRKELKRFPIGVRVQAYSARAAREWKNYPNYFDSDLGTTGYIFDQPEKYSCDYVQATESWATLNHPEWHFAVNYQKNFDLIEKIFAELYPKNEDFTLQNVMDFVSMHAELHHLMGG